MGHIRTAVLVSVLFTTVILLFTSVSVAATGMGMSASSMDPDGENYEFLMVRVVTPDSLEVTVGDTVTWRNLQRPKVPIVLVSIDGLWDDATLYYGKTFSYTFEEPGTYAFTVQDNPAMAGTIVVSEGTMRSVADTSEDEEMMVPEPVIMMTQSNEQVMSRMQEQVMDHRNEFLIVRTLTPTSMEVYAGEAVTWRNLQRPKMPVVLISDEGLWDDQTLYYGKTFSYIFDEPGTYSFSIQDHPEMSGTVVVSEKRMASVEDEDTEAVMVAPGPVMMKEGEEVGTMEQVRVRVEEQTMEHNYEFLLVRVATPESMEIEAGETVTWRNLQRPKFPLVLVSDDGLWDDQTLYYGKTFSYTFENAGTYSFSVQGNPAMTGTIVVK
ncbi:cupredoxin domain-containing protein [Methanolobus profundi]|uniref:Plastocyanin n=1 Tax=Methanolobus profundi TaxID=487685 RepID=A0A1I4USE2_9EURY|nr:cupredoxin domain-containing protein [Methanolobus profundi]SFM91899.1 Plastocyanin [Methanolobus profundi]